MREKNTLGEVDLFGFDDFGSLVGSQAVIGATVGITGSALGAIAVPKLTSSPTALKFRELIGFAVGAGLGGLLWASDRKEAAVVAVATAAISGLIRQAAISFGSTSGLSAPVIDYLNGSLGVPQVEYLNGGLGIPTIGPVSPAYGTIPGVAGPALGDGSLPVDTMQTGSLPGAGNEATLLGAPQPHGMAQMYGATLFGSK